MALNAKQRRFVDEYLVDLNATQAAIRAGYSSKTAAVIGGENLRKPYIQEAISERMKDRELRTEITQDKVLKELAKIGFSDIRKAVKWGDSVAVMNEESGEMVIAHGLCLISSDAVDDSTAAAIAEVSEGKQGLKVKFHDKRAALVDIGRHLGMFKDKVEVSGPNGGPVQNISMTQDEFRSMAKDLLSEI